MDEMHSIYKKVVSVDYSILASKIRTGYLFDYSVTDKMLEESLRRNRWDDWKFEKRRGYIGPSDRREIYKQLRCSEMEYLMDGLKIYAHMHGGEVDIGPDKVPYIIRERKYKVYDMDIIYTYKGIQYHKKLENWRPYNDNIDNISGFDIIFNINNPEEVKAVHEHTETVLELLKHFVFKIKTRN